jgi:hypothetical protein
MAVLAREGGSLKVTVHQLPSVSVSPLTTLAPARNVPLPEQQYDVFFMSQARSCSPSNEIAAWLRSNLEGSASPLNCCDDCTDDR